MKRHGTLRAERLENRELLAANLGSDMAEQMAAFQAQLQAFQAQMRQVQFEAPRHQSPTQSASIDGSGNNLANPLWGSTDEMLLRLTTVEYGDGVYTPGGADRPSAREVSNAVVAQETTEPNDRYLTDLVWLWGQFVDHDIDLTESADPTESFAIEVPQGDPWFDPMGTGTQTIDLSRSIYNHETGFSTDNPRQQINQITAFLDGSVVYGSDQERADALRTFSGGRLKTSEGDLLPFNEPGLHNAGGNSASLFLAGDVRANENAALTSMHTLFVREHNRIADELSAAHPELSDEQLYQHARAIVVAEIQAITYNEFLPALVGENALSDYQGYDPTVNPQISTLFSTASYRFGHSMLSSELLRLNNDGTVIEDGNLSLASAFFAPQEVIDHGIDSLLLGLSSHLANEIDNQIVDDVRNFLFGPPGAGGFDLASLNIQRGRDHGLADYNQTRIDLGLDPVTSFSDITSDPVLASKLEALYGDVNNIDVWVGALAEDHVPGSSLGELNQAVIVDQFQRLRDGDRYWYQNVFSGTTLKNLENTTLSLIIERNTDITGLRDNVFYDDSVMYFEVADKRFGANIEVVSDGNTIDIIDMKTRRVLESRPVDEVSKLMLVGAEGKADRFSIDLAKGGVSLEGGVEVHGRSGSDTMIVHGTWNPDTISVEGDSIWVNDEQMTYTDIEVLHVKPGRGMDDVQVADATDARVMVIDHDRVADNPQPHPTPDNPFPDKPFPDNPFPANPFPQNPFPANPFGGQHSSGYQLPGVALMGDALGMKASASSGGSQSAKHGDAGQSPAAAQVPQAVVPSAGGGQQAGGAAVGMFASQSIVTPQAPQKTPRANALGQPSANQALLSQMMGGAQQQSAALSARDLLFAKFMF